MVARGSGDRDIPDEIAVPAAATRVIGALVPGAQPNFAAANRPGHFGRASTKRGCDEQAVDPDGMFARTPLP